MFDEIKNTIAAAKFMAESALCFVRNCMDVVSLVMLEAASEIGEAVESERAAFLGDGVRRDEDGHLRIVDDEPKGA